MKNALLRRDRADQERDGYVHTLREILQQPSTLIDTCERTIARADDLQRCLQDTRCIVFTGSGSSEYAGACVTLPIQEELGVIAQSVPSGNLLTHGTRVLPPLRPALVLSLARSGDSPESVGVVRLLLESDQQIRHLAVTCNAAGKLATSFQAEARLSVLTLDDRTNDRSLVMTSSFTSLVVAARALGLLSAPGQYRALCRRLSDVFQFVLDHYLDALASVVGRDFDRAVFLGSGSNNAAAKEAALKMLEMTAGRVGTLAETYLGLRHGPMSYLNGETLVVCFISSEPTARAYEIDLIRELERKKLSAAMVIVGEDIPRDLLRAHDVAIECPNLAALGHEDACLVHVLAGQLLAFFRCLKQGLRPDSPSEGGVISRVVESFPLHLDGGRAKIVIVGELNVDLVLQNPLSFPAPGRETLVEDISLTLGSASAICAAALTKLEDQVTFIGKVGCDPWGDLCLASMREVGIDASAVICDKSLKTGITVSITSSKDRALITYLGSIAALTAGEISDSELRGHRHLHVSSFFLQRALRPGLRLLLARAHQHGLTTSLDPGFDPEESWGRDLIDLLEEVDIFLPNETELAGISGIEDRSEALRLLDNGRTIIVAKLGRDGCMAIRNGEMFVVPAFSVDAVDTTGAGDTFNAGFLHAWLEGQTVLEAMTFGAACGALSTLGLGGTASQPTAQQARDFVAAQRGLNHSVMGGSR